MQNEVRKKCFSHFNHDHFNSTMLWLTLYIYIFLFNSQLSGHLSYFPHDVYMVLLENYLVQTSQPFTSSESTQQTERLSPKIMHSFECGLFSLQFSLPRTEKELYEREERTEMQQEILKKVARNLPVYTRMPDGGETATKIILGSLPPRRRLQIQQLCDHWKEATEMISHLLSKGYFISLK